MAQRRPWRRVRLVVRPVRRNDHNDLDNFIKHEFYEYDYRAIQHHFDAARDNNDRTVNNYNGGRKGHYDPSRNYNYFFFNNDDFNDDNNSSSSASPAASASAANND